MDGSDFLNLDQDRRKNTDPSGSETLAVWGFLYVYQTICYRYPLLFNITHMLINMAELFRALVA